MSLTLRIMKLDFLVPPKMLGGITTQPPWALAGSRLVFESPGNAHALFQFHVWKSLLGFELRKKGEFLCHVMLWASDVNTAHCQSSHSTFAHVVFNA